MKARVDAEKGIGCGLCVEICAEVFEMNEDGIAEVKVNPVPAEADECCRNAAESCPVEAITIEES